MALYKIKDFDPDYRNYFNNDDPSGYDLYSRNEKVGSVDNILVDDSGEFRYLVINTGVWILGKKVLLPIGRARIDSDDRRVYADTLTKEQVQNLPEFTDDMTVDFEHEETVRKVYRTPSSRVASPPASGSAPKATAGYGVGYGGADSAPSTSNTAPQLNLSAGYEGYDGTTYTYDRDAELYDFKDERYKLYQERLRASRTRR